MKKYFEDRGVNINKLLVFANRMRVTAEKRNNCAHPVVSPVESAIDARIITYEHRKGECGVDHLNGIRELIFEIFDIV